MILVVSSTNLLPVCKQSSVWLDCNGDKGMSMLPSVRTATVECFVFNCFRLFDICNCFEPFNVYRFPLFNWSLSRQYAMICTRFVILGSNAEITNWRSASLLNLLHSFQLILYPCQFDLSFHYFFLQIVVFISIFPWSVSRSFLSRRRIFIYFTLNHYCLEWNGLSVAFYHLYIYIYPARDAGGTSKWPFTPIKIRHFDHMPIKSFPLYSSRPTHPRLYTSLGAYWSEFSIHRFLCIYYLLRMYHVLLLFPLLISIGMLTVANENVCSGHVVLLGDFLISSLHFHLPLACHLEQLLFCTLLCVLALVFMCWMRALVFMC